MTVIASLAATLLAHGALVAAPPEPSVQTVDVAYAELARGDAQGAIERIRANREVAATDPAALINLGAAHARIGKVRKAEKLYRAAIASPERYELELADGTWMDSRRVARLAIDKLERNETLALR